MTWSIFTCSRRLAARYRVRICQKALEGNVNPFRRELLFHPQLTLYLNRPEWAAAFQKSTLCRDTWAVTGFVFLYERRGDRT